MRHIQNCCMTASFTASRMNSWTLSLHWSCLCWRCYYHYVWSAPSRVSSSQCLYCCTGLKVIVAKDKTPKRGSRWPVVDNPHRSRLTRCPSRDWSSTARVAHQERRSWGGEVLTHPWKYVGRVKVCFDPQCHVLSPIAAFDPHGPLERESNTPAVELAVRLFGSVASWCAMILSISLKTRLESLGQRERPTWLNSVNSFNVRSEGEWFLPRSTYHLSAEFVKIDWVDFA